VDPAFRRCSSTELCLEVGDSRVAQAGSLLVLALALRDLEVELAAFETLLERLDVVQSLALYMKV
jgi:hypothetical protein